MYRLVTLLAILLPTLAGSRPEPLPKQQGGQDRPMPSAESPGSTLSDQPSHSVQYAEYAEQPAHEGLQSAQQQEAAQLLHRLLPKQCSSLFRLRLVPQQPGSHGWFSVQALKGRVHIDGTSGVELASGLHWFLKHWADSSVTWHATGGLQLNHERLTPAAVAALEPKGLVRVERAVPFSFYQNVVTLSYSMAFWEWDRCGGRHMRGGWLGVGHACWVFWGTQACCRYFLST